MKLFFLLQLLCLLVPCRITAPSADYPGGCDYSSESDECEPEIENRGGPIFACRVKGSEWKVCKECDTTYTDVCTLAYTNQCKCRDIEINKEGGSDCTSGEEENKWCYVDEDSSCQDKIETTAVDGLWIDGKKLFYSHQACSTFNEDAYNQHQKDLGNEAFLEDIALSKDEDLGENFAGKGFRLETPEKCQAECLARRKICFGWTFDEFDEDTGFGTCYLKSSTICCNQNVKKMKKEGAISGFTCDNCKGDENCKSCWSTSGACPCKFDVVDNGTEFCSSCDKALQFSATAGLAQEKRPCEFNRVFFQYKNGRWRPVQKFLTKEC